MKVLNSLLSLTVLIGPWCLESARAATASNHCASRLTKTQDGNGDSQLPVIPGGKVEWQRPKPNPTSGRWFMSKTGIFVSKGPNTNGLKMAFDYQLPAGASYSPLLNRKPVMILLHGVGDSRGDLEALATELKNEGWAVLRPDLLGHGETAFLNSADPAKVEPIDYRNQVEMVVGLTQSLGIKKAVVIGHSMGGGLSMVVSKDLKANGIETVANMPVAPYLSAIDKYLSQNGSSPQLLEHQRKKILKVFGIADFSEQVSQYDFAKFGAYGDLMASAIKLQRKLWSSFLRTKTEIRLTLADTFAGRILREFSTSINDFFVIQMMTDMYTKYENLKAEKKSEDLRHTKEQIDMFVKGAIDATVGLRSLDFQARLNPTLMDPTIPTLLVYGDQDPVVIPPQVQDFMQVADGNDYDVTFVEMQSDHFVPQRVPKQLVKRLTEFLNKRGLVPE